MRRWEEAEPQESTFTGPEERLDFAAVLLSVVCFGKAGGAQTQGLRHGESALTSYIHDPQTLMDAPKPGLWAWKVEWGGTLGAVGTGARVLSLCELASGCL